MSRRFRIDKTAVIYEDRIELTEYQIEVLKRLAAGEILKVTGDDKNPVYTLINYGLVDWERRGAFHYLKISSHGAEVYIALNNNR